MYPGVDLRVLQYVIAVADELHFTRAAEKLHVTQPSLSRQVRDLESSLGTKLFERNKQFVRVTAAGAAFVREAKEALLHAERAINLAKAASQPASFALGYSPHVSRSFIASARQVFSTRFSDIRVSLTDAFADEQLSMIRSGMLDAGLVMLPLNAESLAVQSLLLEPLLVALPEKHRLSRGNTIRLRDLKPLPMIVVAKKLFPQLHARIEQAFVRESFQPAIGQEVLTPAEAIAMIADGVGFTFAHDDQYRSPGVVFKRIDGEPLSLESGIVYRPEAASPIVHALIAVLQHRYPVAGENGNQARAGQVA